MKVSLKIRPGWGAGRHKASNLVTLYSQPMSNISPTLSSFQRSGLGSGEPVQLENWDWLVPQMGWVMWSVVAVKENMSSLVSSAQIACGICFLTFDQYCAIRSSGLLSNSYTFIFIKSQGWISSWRHLWWRSAPQHSGMEAFLFWLPHPIHKSLQKRDLCISFPEEEYWHRVIWCSYMMWCNMYPTKYIIKCHTNM